MQKDNLLKELESLIGQKADRKGNACNSLSIHFGEVAFWVDPSWRYEVSGKVMLGSGDFADPESYDTNEEYKIDFQKCCETTDRIKGAELLGAKVGEQNDLALTFSGNQVLRTFHSFTEPDEENWYVSLYEKQIRYLVFPNEVTIEAITRNK